MAQTDVLNIAQVAAGQSQKEVTINDGFLALEQAMSRKGSITLSANLTLTEAQVTRNFILRFSGHAVARVVTIPSTMSNTFAMNRLLAIWNAGTVAGAITIGGSSGTTVVIPINTVSLIYYDGSNCVAVAAASASGYYEQLSNKAVANGYASLDGSGKIPIGQIPSGITGTLTFRGTWNASTNTPTITSGTGTLGYYYIVATAGSSTVDGISSWAVNDQIVYDGTVWKKVDNSGGNEKTANKGIANGYAPLDSSLSVPWANLPTEARQIILGGFLPGKYTSSQVLWYMKAPYAFTLPADLGGTLPYCLAKATSTYVLLIQKNGSTVATVTFDNSSFSGVLSTQAAISFAVNDAMSVVAASAVDATLSDISLPVLGLKV